MLHDGQRLANPGENEDGFPQVVLPNANDAPAILSERLGHKTVAGLVAPYFTARSSWIRSSSRWGAGKERYRS